MSLFGFKIHSAIFYDLRGCFIGVQRIKIGKGEGLVEKTFKYKGGSYNIKPDSSRSRRVYFPYLFDYYDYIYIVGNPDPLKIQTNIQPLMSAEMYNIQLESKVLRDLNNVRQDLLSQLLTPRNLIILVLIVGAIIYFVSGGSVS